jgi:hypothetical protein
MIKNVTTSTNHLLSLRPSHTIQYFVEKLEKANVFPMFQNVTI